MPSWLWFSVSALAAAGLAFWGYARREEPVPRRLVPATLRGLALFLLLAGLRIPALGTRVTAAERFLVLLDRSSSMSLPSRPGGPSRFDSALTLLALEPDGRVLGFGDIPVYMSRDSILPPTDRRTLLAPALEAAQLAGYDSVLIVGDGAWEDPAQVEEIAAASGLGVREERVAASVRRVGLRSVVAPRAVTAGDTARARFELVVSESVPASDQRARATDSVRVRLQGPDAELTEAFALPAPGRAASGELSWVPAFPATGRSEWREYEISLETGADPYESADRARLLIEVADETADAVLVSESPDWEASFLLPVLERATSGGARAYVRTAPDRYASVGVEPVSVDGPVVRRAISAARLLVVQGRPDSLTGMLGRALRAHPRKLVLATAQGSVPGIPVGIGPSLEGEWYAEMPDVPTPTSPLLSELQPGDLPPIQGLPSLAGDWAWAALVSRRERRGEARPLAVAGRTGASRWAVVVGSGYWRWAFRGGAARRAYDGLFGGLAGWLLQGIRRRPVDLAAPAEAGVPLEWRVGPDITNLEITVYDGTAEVWTKSWPTPPPVVSGPNPAAGRLGFEAVGVSPEGRFRVARPFLVRRESAELEPTEPAPIIALQGPGRSRDSRPPRPRAVWPFAAAIALFTAEWIWRRRIGVR